MMNRQRVILLAAISLLVVSMSCGFRDREVAIKGNGLSTTQGDFSQANSEEGGVEIASIDLSQVWKQTNLRSYRSEFQMEIWFEGDGEESSIQYSTVVESTSDPAAQHILSINKSDIFPEEIPEMTTEMYIMDGIMYSKSSLFEQWIAFDGEFADLFGDVLLNPQDYVLLPEKAQRNSSPETVSGISTWHYTFDESAFEDAPVKYEQLSTELWIAVEGGFIVKAETYATGGNLSEDLEDNLFAGMLANSRVRTTYIMTDINSDIVIDLPAEAAVAEVSDLFEGFDFDSEWTREDVPFPNDAEIDYSFSDSISLKTSSSVQEVRDFMVPQMLSYGWRLDMEYLNSDNHYLGDYIKGDEFLALSIDTDLFDQTKTSIYVDVKTSVPWTRGDVTFPPDAFIERSFEGEVYVLTYLAVTEATAFMTEHLESFGWLQETVVLDTESGYIGIFNKGAETMTLMIDPAFDPEGRTRIEIILE